MRPVWIVGCALVVLLWATSAAAFCGFYVSGADAALTARASTVVLLRDGTTTVLSMQNSYEGPAEEFALVVPVPVVLQKENVRTLSRGLFAKVVQLASPRLVEYWEQDPCYEPPRSEMKLNAAIPKSKAAWAGDGAAEPPPKVTVEAEFDVDEYQIVILGATDASALDVWLREHGYKIPAGADKHLRPYVEAGMKFFVAKVDPKKITFQEGRAVLSPLRVHYEDSTFRLPVRLGLINAKDAQDLVVHVLARGARFEVANRPNVPIPTNLDVKDEVRESFGSFYASLFDATLAKHPGAVVTEYAWASGSCDPCPGPVLDAADLSALGVDIVAPPLKQLAFSVPPGTEYPVSSAATQMIPTWREATSGCLDPAASSPEVGQSIELSFPVDAVGNMGAPVPEKEDAKGLAELRSCVAEALTGKLQSAEQWRLRIRVTVAAQQNNGMNWVLTRLHARYDASSLGEDLVFRTAGGIAGGQEWPGSRSGPGPGGGQGTQGLSQVPSPSMYNAFQARYVIRHEWKGPIACASPRRGVWGAPPKGEKWPETQGARDLAFVKRGAQVQRLVRGAQPEFISMPALGDAPPDPTTKRPPSPPHKPPKPAVTVTSSTSTSEGSGGSGAAPGCGCEAPGDAESGPRGGRSLGGGAALFVLFVWGVRARGRRRGRSADVGRGVSA